MSLANTLKLVVNRSSLKMTIPIAKVHLTLFKHAKYNEDVLWKIHLKNSNKVNPKLTNQTYMIKLK